MHISEVIQKSILIRDYLKNFEDYPENPIDSSLLPVSPFKIGNDIKLIIIGQDLTKRKANRRNFIDTTLNLNKSGALKSYIKKIYDILDIEIENVYATNVFKYFYISPPADTPEILKSHLKPNLHLLIKEIEQHRNAKIVTMGEPVLRLLVKEGQTSKMTYYWNCKEKTRQTDGKFQFCPADVNHLAHNIFPIPHQSSSIKKFYSKTLEDYLLFVKNER